MATLITDPVLERRLQEERAERGADRYDEVWEGVYVMAPMPDNEHQQLVARFTRIFEEVIGDAGLGDVLPGVNVSDRIEGWERNYRVPDVAVYLATTNAQNHDAFWFGGPDFAVEIVSPHDRSRDKLDFYSAVGTRELLVVDRAPWRLELYTLDGERLVSAGLDSLDVSRHLSSSVLKLSFQLRSGQPRPRIEVRHSNTAKMWTI